MDCNEIRELMSLDVDNLLKEEEKNILNKHLSQCAECKKEYDDLKSVVENLQDVPEVPLPENFKAELRVKLEAEKNSKKVIKNINWRRYSAVAAIFLIGIVSIIQGDFLDKSMDKMKMGSSEQIMEKSTDGFSAEIASDLDNEEEAMQFTANSKSTEPGSMYVDSELKVTQDKAALFEDNRVMEYGMESLIAVDYEQSIGYFKIQKDSIDEVGRAIKGLDINAVEIVGIEEPVEMNLQVEELNYSNIYEEITEMEWVLSHKSTTKDYTEAIDALYFEKATIDIKIMELNQILTTDLSEEEQKEKKYELESYFKEAIGIQQQIDAYIQELQFDKIIITEKE